MRTDLHIHTQESDGSLSVEEIIKLANKNDVRVLSITDHESTQGINQAQKLGFIYDIHVIPGLELLTYFEDQEIHLLGYFKDINNHQLQSRLKELREQRTALAYEMVKLLQIDGFPLKWRDVELEGGTEVAISKGHIMSAIYHQNMVGNTSWKEISGFFLPGGLAYLPFTSHRFDEAVDFIKQTGGVPVLAHPGLIAEPNIVPKLLACGISGIEVYYGYWEKRAQLIKFYQEIAETNGLLATGGSDYHGPFSRVQLGQLEIPFSVIKNLQKHL